MTAPAIWRGYSRAELDRQYDSRGTVPDVSVYLNEYAARTRRAKAHLACVENLSYGARDDERLDIYPAHASEGAPVLVFLHGGDWRALSKEDSGFAAPAFASRGVLFAALDFTLVPHTTISAMGRQVRSALAWLHANVVRHGGDPRRIHIAGHSSGANLVGQLLMTDWADAGVPSDLVKSAAFLSGLGDLEPVRLSFRNKNLGLSPAMAAEVSLLKHRPTTNCPMLVVVGSRETEDYRRQSRDVTDHWRALGNACALLELPGRHHFDAVLEWADPESAVFKAHCAVMGV